MKNIGGRAGGSITAAQFIQRFVNKKPWAHLDIAGMAWSSKDAPMHAEGRHGVRRAPAGSSGGGSLRGITPQRGRDRLLSPDPDRACPRLWRDCWTAR